LIPVCQPQFLSQGTDIFFVESGLGQGSSNGKFLDGLQSRPMFLQIIGIGAIHQASEARRRIRAGGMVTMSYRCVQGAIDSFFTEITALFRVDHKFRPMQRLYRHDLVRTMDAILRGSHQSLCLYPVVFRNEIGNRMQGRYIFRSQSVTGRPQEQSGIDATGKGHGRFSGGLQQRFQPGQFIFQILALPCLSFPRQVIIGPAGLTETCDP